MTFSFHTFRIGGRILILAGAVLWLVFTSHAAEPQQGIGIAPHKPSTGEQGKLLSSSCSNREVSPSVPQVAGKGTVIPSQVVGGHLDLVSPQESAQQPLSFAEKRMQAARRTYQLLLGAALPHFGTTELEALYRWSRRWAEAEQEAARESPARIAAVAAHLARMKTLELRTRTLHESGTAPASAVAATEFYRSEAEQWLQETSEK